MAHVPDDLLMAFVDGQLTDAERGRLEAILAGDPALRRRLEPFAVTRAALPIIFDQPLREPVSARLLETIHSAGRTPARTTSTWPAFERNRESSSIQTNVIAWLRDLLAPANGGMASGFAYAAMLAIGAGAGWLGATAFGSGGLNRGELVIFDQGGLVAGGKLREALTTAKSGELISAEVNGGNLAGIVPVLSFRSLDGRFCRQYQIGSKGGHRFAGLACRDANGNWNVSNHVEATLGVSVKADDGNEDQQKAIVPALEAAVDRMIEGEALSAEDEAQIIKNGWSSAGAPKQKGQ